jgi:hypothetical protein
VADILAHKVVARHRDQLALPYETERPKNACHPQGAGGLACAAIAGEGHVQVRPLGGVAEPLPDPFDQQQRGDFAETGFDRLQADQIFLKRLEIELQPAAENSACRSIMVSAAMASAISSASLRASRRHNRPRYREPGGGVGRCGPPD